MRQVKKAKPKPSAKTAPRPSAKTSSGELAYRKPALRSEAFATALAEAKSCADDPARLAALFEEAARKTASISRELFRETWPYLYTMLRLVRAHERGEYRQVSSDALLWIVAALTYLVDPFDLIPDRTPFLGFVDDADVIEFVTNKVRPALDDFMQWETAAQ
jgi:uncharacterized membrane protein YkvA (DUF1232 family)